MAVAAAVGLDRAHLTRLARNSFTGSFLDDGEIAARLGQIDAYLADS